MSAELARSSPVVLCVVAEPILRTSIRDALAAGGWSVVPQARPSEAVMTCLTTRPDLIVLECGLEGGRELVAELASHDDETRVPSIALGAPAAGLELVAAGASDWLSVPAAPEVVQHRANAVLRGARAVRELASLRSKVAGEESAESGADAVPPRERFLQRVDTILRNPRSRREDTAVLLVALEAGEGGADAGALSACLPTLTKRLREVLRTRDGLSPASGQGPSAPLALVESAEFTVLLERQERPQEAYKIARRLQQQLEKPVELDGRKIPVHVNIGIAVHPADGSTAAELDAAARKAMGRARQEQMHGIRFATAAMNSSTFERLTLESNLRYALEREELTVFYQPRVELATGRIVGFEALLRWKHPELGMVSPGQFIPIAEESGLIVPIGEWVLREACRQNKRWRDEGLPHACMAVNLSAVQFRQPDLEVRVARILEETALDPSGLELELTESLLLHKADETIETLRTIKEMGIHLSIDDFGTGYSSLSYIKRFPVDALKIDQSFVREVTTSAEDSAITTSIVLMGKSLNLTVVAEGVETKSQLEFLRALECDEAQGYLFSRPVPAKEAGVLLKSGFPAFAPGGAPVLVGATR